jgi:hypothetical protein
MSNNKQLSDETINAINEFLKPYFPEIPLSHCSGPIDCKKRNERQRHKRNCIKLGMMEVLAHPEKYALSPAQVNTEELENLRAKVAEYEQSPDDKDLIIQGIEEGAEEWQREAEDIAFALHGLVSLKDIKDKPNKTPSEIKQYEMAKPEAWQEARSVLQRTQAGQRIKAKLQPYLDFLSLGANRSAGEGKEENIYERVLSPYEQVAKEADAQRASVLIENDLLKDRLAELEAQLKGYRDMLIETEKNKDTIALGTEVYDLKNERVIYVSFGEDKDILVDGKKWVPEAQFAAAQTGRHEGYLILKELSEALDSFLEGDATDKTIGRY